MAGNGHLPRRRFLEVAASSAAVTAACGGRKSPWRFLTDAEAITLAAICDQIIPPDQDLGASQAGVVDYIDRQLTGHFRKQQTAYREGLAAINEIAERQYGAQFEHLPGTQQLALLEQVDAKKLGDGRLRPFLDTLISHTMQGYYGSPRHGGNRGWASWHMLGVPTSPVRGRLQYDLKRS